MATALMFTSYGALAALAAAAGACAFRRWRLAVTVSRALVLGGPLILLAGFAGFMICPPNARDPSAQAVALSQGVSEAVSCGALIAITTTLGAALWGIARWRDRATRPGR